MRYITMLRYTSSVIYRKKSLRAFVFQHQIPSLCLTLSGLIGPRRAYHELATPTAVLNFEKKYHYVSLTIQLNNNHLFTQLNNRTVLFLLIKFSKSHLQFKYPYLSTPSTRAEYDTRSFFKRSLTSFNSEFSFS